MTVTEIVIPGLKYFSDFITQIEHDNLLAEIDKQPWLPDLRRRVQHFGYRYNYKARRVKPAENFIDPLPDWIEPLIDQIRLRQVSLKRPDQLIINEYLPGQGISPHIDCVSCFEETVLSLSLGSACVMNFQSKSAGMITPKLLQSRSLLVFRGEARYNWMHGISPRKSDIFDGISYNRSRRISLTFRNVIV